MKRSRNWCFTDFTLKNGQEAFEEEKNHIRYICWAEETCPETKRKHHQGYVQFKGPVTMANAKKRLGLPGVHLEQARGSVDENKEYCAKEGALIEFGEASTQGQRTDIDGIKALIDKGANEVEIAEANFQLYAMYARSFARYKTLKTKTLTQKFRKITVILLEGYTGCGKSRFAIERSGYVISGCDLQWFDHYESEHTITIDDYSNDVKINRLLRILDGYQLRLPTKGGHTYANWRTVFITTNLQELHQNASEAHRAALRRRINHHFIQWDETKKIQIDVDAIDQEPESSDSE